MLIKVITLSFDSALGGFNESMVRDFIKDCEVISIRDHFFIRNEMPYLTLVIQYFPIRQELNPKMAPQGKREEEWRETLSESDMGLFNLLRIFEIQDPKVRKICSSDLRDRVVHHAVCTILDPIFERRLISDSYACRVGKGSHAALKRCQHFAGKNAFYLKCDIKKFFESVDHHILKSLLRRIIKDPRLLHLLDRIIDHTVPGSEKAGLPIGNLTSQYFANLYLGKLDYFLKDHHRVKSYLRYMDDFIVFGPDKRSLQNLLDQIRCFLKKELKLELKEKVTRIAPVSEGIPFLGMRVYKSLIRIQRPNLVRFRKKMKLLETDYIAGKISEKEFLNSMNSRIAHLSHANTFYLRKNDFEGSIGLA
jgi:RNA-directed DNA polymerase